MTRSASGDSLACPARHPRPGGYWKVDHEVFEVAPAPKPSPPKPMRVTLWLGPKDGYSQIDRGGIGKLTPAEVGHFLDYTWAELAALPTDPAALRKALAEKAKPQWKWAEIKSPSAHAPAELALKPWQLPELLSVVVDTEGVLPTKLSRTPEPYRRPATK